MKHIIASRCTGKSTTLLRMALRDNANIAVHTAPAIREFLIIAEEIGIEKSEITVTKEYVVIKGVVVAPLSRFLERPKSSPFAGHKKLYIDELDLCLQCVFPYHHIAGYTNSIEDRE